MPALRAVYQDTGCLWDDPHVDEPRVGEDQAHKPGS